MIRHYQEDHKGVALLSVERYRRDSLVPAVDQLLSETVGSTSFFSSKVLLKPNLISARNASLACTEPAVIEAVARWFIDKGAKVQIGDSPAFGSAKSVLAAMGMHSSLQSLGVDIVNFDKAVPARLPSGIQVQLAVKATECDVLVNIPRVKAHVQMRVTMAVKNLFGCIVGMQKGWYHMIHGGRQERFAELIVQLPSVLPSTISLLDGITAMNKIGPIDGEPVNLGVMGCSSNPVALDTAFLDLLNIIPETSPLWLAAQKKKLPGASLNELEWLLSMSSELKTYNFRAPGELIPVRFNPLRFVKSFFKRIYLRFSR